MIVARLTPGAISVSNCSHLPPFPASILTKPVRFPPGRGTLATKPAPTGFREARKYNRDHPRLPLSAAVPGVLFARITLQLDQFLGEDRHPINVACRPTNIHPQVAAIDPTQLRKTLYERCR
jgi:hypothetical protein